MMKQRLLYLLGALIVTAVMVWAFSPRPLEVETEALRRGRFERSVEDDGWTRVRDRYVVSAPLAGQLARITLREGDTVQRGDVIAWLRPASPTLLDERSVRTQHERIRALDAQERAADAVLKSAQTALQQAEADARRSEQLHARGFIAAAQRDATQLALGLREQAHARAAHEAEAARHARAEAQAMLRPASGSDARAAWPVRAPVSGRVLRLPQQSEAVVAVGAPLIEIGDPAQLEVIADLLTEDAAQVREGMAAQLLNWGSRAAHVPLAARVRRIEPSAFTKVSALGVEEQRVNVVLDLVSPPAQWQALGDRFRVDVRIPVQAADDALMVPVGALFPQRGRDAMFVLREDRAVLTEVEVIARNGREAWLKSEGKKPRQDPQQGKPQNRQPPLPPGTEVIVYPPPSLRDGDSVTRLRR